MPASTTLTVRLTPKVKEQLGRLAKHTSRTKSFLANEAISGFVARELSIIEGIKRGLADVEAGRVVSHEDAVARLNATVAKSAKRRRCGAGSSGRSMRSMISIKSSHTSPSGIL